MDQDLVRMTVVECLSIGKLCSIDRRSNTAIRIGVNTGLDSAVETSSWCRRSHVP